MVEKVDEHGVITEEEILGKHCHHFGELLSHDEGSVVALSTCKGLVRRLWVNWQGLSLQLLKTFRTVNLMNETAAGVDDGDGTFTVNGWQLAARIFTVFDLRSNLGENYDCSVNMAEYP